MPRISPLKVALGVGAAGAMVDVSSSVRFVEGLNFSEGQTNQFQDAAAGAVTFVIENYTGQYTPNNPGSTLLTPMAEGTVVTTQVGSLVREFSIVSFGFPTSQTDDGLLTLLCDDMLGDASRVDLDLLATDMVMGSSPYLYYPLNEPAGSPQSLDQSGNNGAPSAIRVPLSGASTGSVTYGVAGPAASGGDTQLQLANVATQTLQFGPSSLSPAAYVHGSVGFIGASVTAPDAQVWGFGDIAPDPLMPQVESDGLGNLTIVALGPTVLATTRFSVTNGAYISLGVTYVGTTLTANLYANGVLIASGTRSFGGTVVQQSQPIVFVGPAQIAPVSFAHLSRTPTLVHEEAAGVTTEAGRLQAIAAAVPEITLGTLPSDLSTAPIGVANVSGGSAFDAINAVMRTEQGYVYTATSGTLLAPSQTIQFRARNRPATPAYTFDAVTEIGDYLPFVRDITYLAKTTTATGPDTSATFTDSTLSQRAGSKNASETVAFEDYSDLYTWATDRSNRAKNAVLSATSVTIDALTIPTDRSADLLAMRRGDRIRITDIPSTSLGFTTWDGWLIGKTESHTLTSHTFTLYLAPCTPATAVWQNNTISGEGNRWMAGGVLSLSSALTSGATTASVATSDPLTKFTTTAGHFPVDILIDTERITVTNCTAATPQVMTITRGVGGTTAVTHSASALVELFTPALWAY